MNKAIYIAPKTELTKNLFFTEYDLMAGSVNGNTGGGPGIDDGGGGDPGDFSKKNIFGFDDKEEENIKSMSSGDIWDD